MGRIVAVCISEEKGTEKRDVGACSVTADYGFQGDAHAGSERQVSLLSAESVEDFRVRSEGKAKLHPGVFGENLLTEGLDLRSAAVGDRILCGEAVLEITQIGKKCHKGCRIRETTGECIMPSEGVFARVIKGGLIKRGDEIGYE